GHHPQEEASGEAEGGKETDEEGRAGGHPAAGLPRRFEGGMTAETAEPPGGGAAAVGNSARPTAPPAGYESLLVAGPFVVFLRTFVVQTYQVPTGSMEKPSLVGDHLLVNKSAYAPRLPALAKLLPDRDVRRGDIIVFKKPGDDVTPGNVLVKRAVAAA